MQGYKPTWRLVNPPVSINKQPTGVLVWGDLRSLVVHLLFSPLRASNRPHLLKCHFTFTPWSPSDQLFGSPSDFQTSPVTVRSPRSQSVPILLVKLPLSIIRLSQPCALTAIKYTQSKSTSLYISTGHSIRPSTWNRYIMPTKWAIIRMRGSRCRIEDLRTDYNTVPGWYEATSTSSKVAVC